MESSAKPTSIFMLATCSQTNNNSGGGQGGTSFEQEMQTTNS